MTAVLIALTLVFLPQDPKAAALPDTPQGKHVAAWVKAFNAGDEKAFLSVQEQHMSKGALTRRPEAERAKMFRRMRGDFPELKITKVLESSAHRIQFQVPARDGGVGTFTFEFDAQAPHLISTIGIDVQGP